MGRQVLSWIVAFALSWTVPVTARAEIVPAFKEFSFKRIGVPPPGTKKRILVQIEPKPEPDPAEQAESSDATDLVSTDPSRDDIEAPDGPTGYGASSAAFGWYWDTVSPRMADVRRGRFIDAVAALDKAPGGLGVNAPRLSTLERIARDNGQAILKATIGTRISPALVLAMIAVESGGNSTALSPVGAAGLMQLMPDTATRFGVTNRNDPAQSISGGVAYIDWLMNEFGGDAVLALAGYNAGEGAVQRSSGVPNYAETRAYVPKVLAAWKVARSLCLTPPMLASDGCVFAGVTLASN